MRIYSNNDWKIDQREIKVTINMPYNSRVLVEPMHSHEFMELSYVLAGEAVQIINGVTCPVRKGNIILMRPGIRILSAWRQVLRCSTACLAAIFFRA